jgi:DNA-directed RNA polymerase specialized sigma24 family protein
MSNQQTAEVLDITLETASADWSYARAWLRVEMASLGEANG